MDTRQQAALSQWNETKPRRGTSPIADAELAHRVAYADAHTAYESALAKASRDLLAATDRADRRLSAAQDQQRSDDLHRSNMAAYYRDRAEALLVEDLHRFRYMLSPQYGVHRDRTLDGKVQMHIDLISAELARRGVDVS